MRAFQGVIESQMKQALVDPELSFNSGAVRFNPQGEIDNLYDITANFPPHGLRIVKCRERGMESQYLDFYMVSPFQTTWKNLVFTAIKGIELSLAVYGAYELYHKGKNVWGV